MQSKLTVLFCFALAALAHTAAVDDAAVHPPFIEWSADMQRAFVSMPASGVAQPPGYEPPVHTCVHDAIAKNTTTLVDPQEYDVVFRNGSRKRQTTFQPFRVLFDFQFLGGVRSLHARDSTKNSLFFFLFS